MTFTRSPAKVPALLWVGDHAWFRLALGMVLAGIGLGLGGCATANEPVGVHPGLTSVEPFFECRGQASAAPTVVLEAGAFGTSADWGLAMRDLVKTGRVCAYDRLGLGRSPDRTNPPTPENIARDLSNALDSLGETQPVILVGHSNGALYVETFATLFPARVAGVLYVDGVGSDDLDEPLVMADLQDEETLARLAAIGGRMGLAPLVVQPTIDAIGLQDPSAHHKWAALTSPRHLENARDEVLQILPALRRVREIGGVGPTTPTAVVVASLAPTDPTDRAWRQAQAAPARRACQGWVIDANGATHVSPLGRDRSYLLAAIDWLQTPGLKSASTCDAQGFRP